MPRGPPVPTAGQLTTQPRLLADGSETFFWTLPSGDTAASGFGPSPSGSPRVNDCVLVSSNKDSTSTTSAHFMQPAAAPVLGQPADFTRSHSMAPECSPSMVPNIRAFNDASRVQPNNGFRRADYDQNQRDSYNFFRRPEHAHKDSGSNGFGHQQSGAGYNYSQGQWYDAYSRGEEPRNFEFDEKARRFYEEEIDRQMCDGQEANKVIELFLRAGGGNDGSLLEILGQ